ncbi:hypothetical protein V2I01_31630 [Micromonospora sp. BRA006-A]|nr:hypothetical protein [Micromonospora sp. BRA006-A]
MGHHQPHRVLERHRRRQQGVRIGWTPNVTARITIHHNWIHDTNVRNPSTDNVQHAHLYNNYMQNVRSYGNYSRGKTKMVIENTYYDKVKDPYHRDDTAEIRQTGSICVSCTGQRETGGSAFTPSSFTATSSTPPTRFRTSSDLRRPQAAIGQ